MVLGVHDDPLRFKANPANMVSKVTKTLLLGNNIMMEHHVCDRLVMMVMTNQMPAMPKRWRNYMFHLE